MHSTNFSPLRMSFPPLVFIQIVQKFTCRKSGSPILLYYNTIIKSNTLCKCFLKFDSIFDIFYITGVVKPNEKELHIQPLQKTKLGATVCNEALHRQ
jgi:hypothetical protein